MRSLPCLALILLVCVGGTSLARWKVNHQALPGKAVGRLINRFGQICTAFLSGPQQVTTAGHCLLGGTEGMIFQLHYRDGNATEQVRVRAETRDGTKSPIFLMGGGGNTEDQYYGADWAHVLLETAIGWKYGWIELYSGIARTNMSIRLYGYRGDWKNGESARASQCQIKDPPSNFRQFCQREGNSYTCNFFTIQGCEISTKGGDSGGPLTIYKDGVHYAVGILTGRAGIGTRVFPISLTVNDTKPEAANVYFHWLNLRNLSAITVAGNYLRHKRTFYAGVDSTSQQIYDWIRSRKVNQSGPPTWVASNWSRLSIKERIFEIQKWSSSNAQKSLLYITNKFLDQAKEQKDEQYVSFRIHDLPKNLVLSKNERHSFGFYYIDRVKTPFPAKERMPLWRMSNRLPQYPNHLSQYPADSVFVQRMNEMQEELLELNFLHQNYPKLRSYVSIRKNQIDKENKEFLRYAKGKIKLMKQREQALLAQIQQPYGQVQSNYGIPVELLPPPQPVILVQPGQIIQPGVPIQ